MKSLSAVFLSLLFLVDTGRGSPIDNCRLVPDKYDACVASLIRQYDGDCRKLCGRDSRCLVSCSRASHQIYGSADAKVPPSDGILSGNAVLNKSVTPTPQNTQKRSTRRTGMDPSYQAPVISGNGLDRANSIDDCYLVPEKFQACMISLIKQNNGDCRQLCGTDPMCLVSCYEALIQASVDATVSPKDEISPPVLDSSITHFLQKNQTPSDKNTEKNPPKVTPAALENTQKPAANPVGGTPSNVMPPALDNGQKSSPNPVGGTPSNVMPPALGNGQKSSPNPVGGTPSNVMPPALDNGQKSSPNPVGGTPSNVMPPALGNGQKSSPNPVGGTPSNVMPPALDNGQKSSPKPVGGTPSNVMPPALGNGQKSSPNPVGGTPSNVMPPALDNGQKSSPNPVEVTSLDVLPSALDNGQKSPESPVEVTPLDVLPTALDNGQKSPESPVDVTPLDVLPTALDNGQKSPESPVGVTPLDVLPTALDNGQKSPEIPVEVTPLDVLPTALDDSQKSPEIPVEVTPLDVLSTALDNSQESPEIPVEVTPLDVLPTALDNSQKSPEIPVEVTPLDVLSTALDNSQESPEIPVEVTPLDVLPTALDNGQKSPESPMEMTPLDVLPTALDNSQKSPEIPVEVTPLDVLPTAIAQESSMPSETAGKPAETNPSEVTPPILQDDQEASASSAKSNPSKTTISVLGNSKDPSANPVEGSPHHFSGTPTPLVVVQEVTSFVPESNGETGQTLDNSVKSDPTVHDVVNSEVVSASLGAIGGNQMISTPNGDSYGTQNVNGLPSVAPSLTSSHTVHLESSVGSDGAIQQNGEASLPHEENILDVTLEGDASANTRNELVESWTGEESQEVLHSESFTDISHALATEVPPSLDGTDGQSHESPQDDATALPASGTAQAPQGTLGLQTHKIVSGPTLPATASGPSYTKEPVTDITGDAGDNVMNGAMTSDLGGEENGDNTAFTLEEAEDTSNASSDRSNSGVPSETIDPDSMNTLFSSLPTSITTTLAGNGGLGDGGSGGSGFFPETNGDLITEHPNKVPSAINLNTVPAGQLNSDGSAYSKSGSSGHVELTAAPPGTERQEFVTGSLDSDITINKDNSEGSTNNMDHHKSIPTEVVTVDKSMIPSSFYETPDATDRIIDVSSQPKNTTEQNNDSGSDFLSGITTGSSEADFFITVGRNSTNDLLSSSQKNDSLSSAEHSHTTIGPLHASEAIANKSTTSTTKGGNSTGSIALNSRHTDAPEALRSTHQANIATKENIHQTVAGTEENIHHTNATSSSHVATATHKNELSEPTGRNVTGQHFIPGDQHGKPSPMGGRTSTAASTVLTSNISGQSNNTRVTGATASPNITHPHSKSPQNINGTEASEAPSRSSIGIKTSTNRIGTASNRASTQDEYTAGSDENTTFSSGAITGCSSNCSVNHTISHSRETVVTSTHPQYTSREHVNASTTKKVENTTTASPTTELQMKVINETTQYLPNGTILIKQLRLYPNGSLLYETITVKAVLLCLFHDLHDNQKFGVE
ncbi:hypothetical protein Y032_0010g1210 [Ancylostoma ceylanicum]|uniref:WAP domain-containing protein n=1 Tax=Ancylostoma ceylanicum TaxID=53326 RepID=A0A016VGN3_9BILA|nr:hypothetical protein Y032_0010g1210 [Ancylostoma ceylanicum]